MVLLLLSFKPLAAVAQDADATANGTTDALQQLVPALLGTQAPTGTKSLTVTGNGSAVPGPQSPTPPAVPSVHMGAGTPNDAAPLQHAFGAILNDTPGLSAGTGDPPPLYVDPHARDADFSALRAGDTATVAQIIDPTRFRLDDGRIVQLAGIDTADDDPYDPGPASLAARNWLKTHLEGQKVRLYLTNAPDYGRVTRLGDLLAQVETPRDGVWVQGAMLSSGLARLRPTERNPEMGAQEIKLEDAARAGKRGLWADGKYAVLTPNDATTAMNSWAIVEGRIFGASTERNTTFLNFGPDYRKDFTVGIDSAIRRQLLARGIDPEMLAGRSVRVRGWIRQYNGPYLKLNNGAWLELIPENNTQLP